MSKTIRARYEKGVLKPLEPLQLREGEEVEIWINKPIRRKLKDLVGILGESSETEFKRYLDKV